MKLLKVAAIASALTLSLTGCSGIPGLTPEEPVSMIGLTGTDLTNVYKMDDMNVDDQLMMFSCRGLTAYLTDIFPNDAGDAESLNPGEGKDLLRSFGLDHLKMVEEDYPETSIYIDGVMQELADSDSEDPGFESYKKFCRTYNEVQKSIEKHYVEPLLLQTECWSSQDINLSIEEKVGDEWVSRYDKSELEKVDFCEGDYPWGYSWPLSRSDYGEDRIFRMVLASNDGGTVAGKEKYVTFEQTITQYDTEPLTFSG